jgi:hypothetical protein
VVWRNGIRPPHGVVHVFLSRFRGSARSARTGNQQGTYGSGSILNHGHRQQTQTGLAQGAAHRCSNQLPGYEGYGGLRGYGDSALNPNDDTGVTVTVHSIQTTTRARRALRELSIECTVTVIAGLCGATKTRWLTAAASYSGPMTISTTTCSLRSLPSAMPIARPRSQRQDHDRSLVAFGRGSRLWRWVRWRQHELISDRMRSASERVGVTFHTPGAHPLQTTPAR